MITRIFRARVPVEKQQQFEDKFLAQVLQSIKSYPGVVSVYFGRPTRGAPDEFAVISTWASEKFLAAFAGENWSQAVIPAGMEDYVTECWVHHYQVFG